MAIPISILQKGRHPLDTRTEILPDSGWARRALLIRPTWPTGPSASENFLKEEAQVRLYDETRVVAAVEYVANRVVDESLIGDPLGYGELMQDGADTALLLREVVGSVSDGGNSIVSRNGST